MPQVPLVLRFPVVETISACASASNPVCQVMPVSDLGPDRHHRPLLNVITFDAPHFRGPVPVDEQPDHDSSVHTALFGEPHLPQRVLAFGFGIQRAVRHRHQCAAQPYRAIPTYFGRNLSQTDRTRARGLSFSRTTPLWPALKLAPPALRRWCESKAPLAPGARLPPQWVIYRNPAPKSPISERNKSSRISTAGAARRFT